MNSDQRTVNRGQRSDGLVENFLQQWRKPFGLQTISEMTGAEMKLVRKVIRAQITAGKVIEMEPGIYRSSIQQQISNSNEKWSYSVEVATKVLGMLRRKRYSNVRSLAADMGVSRTYVQKYLAALASMGAVSWDGVQYTGISDADLSRLGCRVDPHILTALRRQHECG